MAHQLERLMQAIRAKPGRTIAIALAAVAVLWFVVGRKPSTPEIPAPVEQSQEVTIAPFMVVKGFRGTIAPGDSAAVIAPFEGAVKQINFAYGDQVEAGQLLLQIDPSEVAGSRNDAEAGYLKAGERAEEIRTWQSGSEMAGARRSLESAKLELGRIERRLQETKTLLDRGLVPRAEYEGMQQQLEAQRTAVIAAEESLRDTERRGGGVTKRVSSLELANAARRFEQINTAFNGAAISAPAAGVIVLPPAGASASGSAGGGGGDRAIRVGSRVSKGQVIGAIAGANGLIVTFELDESDVNAVRAGQPAMIIGPGFPFSLNGQVLNVAGQANEAPPGSKVSFKASVRLAPLTPEQMEAVRIGMSANIRVLAYSNPKAIAVPTQAVQGFGPRAFVMVRQKDGTTRKASVKVGKVAPDRVEIVTGLKAGDVVVWTPPAPLMPPGPPQKPKGRLFGFF